VRAVTHPNAGRRSNAEIVKALQDPETKALLEKQAMQTVGNSPEDFAAFIKLDIAVWKDVAVRANVEVK
jgi:tripartite-type tricarboxylate transporter receptor subunit TctC